MRRSFAIALCSVITSLGVARADDPLPAEQAPADEPGASGENAAEPAPAPAEPAPAPAPAPAAPAPSAPAPEQTKRARVMSPASRSPGKPRGAGDGDGRLEKKEDTILGGRHWRVKTAQGAVHVWIPPGYDREKAGTVIYVHGYYTDADGAWRDYELAKQFKASNQNAMFIVPDAPAGNEQSVQWPALTDLRR
ncbi:MAG TPA: hypothetical protein VN253_12340, partial [Kofleriaceae bacterium]|nr:hypothetical protein [Kofleriaceae bacterium]